MRRLAQIVLYVPITMVACLFFCFLFYYLNPELYKTIYMPINALFGNSIAFCVTLYLITTKFKVCRHSKSALATMSFVSIFNFVDSIFKISDIYYYPIICLSVYGVGLLISVEYLFKDLSK